MKNRKISSTLQRAEPKHLELMFQGINFGNGTGFRNTSGEPVNIHRRASNKGGPGRGGNELFGSYAASLLGKRREKARLSGLSLYSAAYGGNGDNQIDNRDSVFYSLKLWQDRNHNGISEGAELQNLSGSVISMIHLKYKESRHKDENGNWFRYRAKVTDADGTQAGRSAWDVFLQKPD